MIDDDDEPDDEEPPRLFDLGKARAERDDAIDRVSRRTNAMACAQQAAKQVLRRHEDFTAETIREELRATDPDGYAAVDSEPRVLGAVMRWLERSGRAFPLERHVQTGRRSNHARPQRVWRARVGGGAS